jgi:flagellar M-ring protein FliF
LKIGRAGDIYFFSWGAKYMENVLNKIRQFGSRVRDILSRLSLNQKVLFGGAALMIIIAVVILMVNSNTVQYETLYTDLSDKDAAAIVDQLTSDKTPYKLEDNGTTILVPADVKYDTRLKMAGQNLPQGQAGFELFQQNNFGETQSDKKVKYQEALQGELARTIQSLDKVKAARVHLALPEDSLFSENQTQPSASIAITTKTNETLTPKEVKGIIHLVANSVEKLDPKNIVIVDHNGNLISDNLPAGDGSSTDLVKQQMAMKTQYEKEKQAAIQSMLDQTLGAGNSVVRINVELNFNDSSLVDKKYTHDPDGPFVRSEQINTESGTNQAPQQTGVPGTDTNISQYTETTPQSGNSSYDKSSKTRNYEINETQTTTKLSQGDVKYDYLTISVLVNNAKVAKMNLGDTEAARIDKIRSIVATASWLRENRPNENVNLKDNISVAFMDFYAEPAAEPKPSGVFGKLGSWAPWALAVFSLLVILLVWRLASKKQEEMEEPGFDTVVEEEIKIEDLIDRNLTPEEREREKIRAEIEKFVDEDPASAAQVVKTWLQEDAR